MIYNESVKICEAYLLPIVSELYGLEGYEITPVNAHMGGRNVVYTCEKEGTDAKILRISFLHDRSREDFQGEVEYVRYLFEHGGSVSDVVNSRKGNLLEEITHNNHTFLSACLKRLKEKGLLKIIIDIGKEFQFPNTIIIAVKSWGKCTNYQKGTLLFIVGIVFLINTLLNISKN
ncbi:hypothetical protein [Falsibacillus pallidus]|uniref:Phosphotransferase family enzyme n=1 Tax=Falsibacillus pallidus TaxID=493781 RepID=A0A370G2U6_9BACI|nr:hypothetical protein [Falsibacillus pallidus]RDI38032.1 hypothetical protein DFR59_11944 [Falsibacillus pallidus]